MNKTLLVITTSLICAASALTGCGGNSAADDVQLDSRIESPFEAVLSKPLFDNKNGEWFHFDVTIANNGDRDVLISPLASGAFIANNALLVEDTGCGYSADDVAKGKFGVTCSVNEPRVVIGPGQRQKLTTIKAIKGLKGMPELKAGNHSWTRKVQWRYEGSDQMKTTELVTYYNVT